MPERVRLLRLLEFAIEDPNVDRSELMAVIGEAEPADVAQALQEHDPGQTIPLFQQIPHEHAAAILVEMTEEYQREVIRELPVSRLQQIVDSLPPDDAADIYNLLPHAYRIGILESVDRRLAAQIRKLAAYEEETAGAIMTPRFVAVRQNATVGEVLADIKRAEDLETDQVYVLDADSRLEGVVSLQEILAAEDQTRPVQDLMDDQVLAVHEDADQEEVVRVSTRYGLATVPVVDDQRHIVGIVTADDLDYVQAEEANEDVFRMAGTRSRHPTKLPISRRVLNRLPMLVGTVLMGLLAAQILALLGHSAETGAGSLRLSAIRYVLIVIALAGNVGNISTAVVVRGLATQELEYGRLLQPFASEVAVGFTIGIICAILTFFGVGVIEPVHWLPLGGVVASALLTAVTFSSVAGFVLPLFCDRIGIDPALAGPMVTALNDLAGTAMYVTTCLLLLDGGA